MPTNSQTAPFQADDLKKYSGLLSEFGQVIQKVHDQVHYPEPRHESRLLKLLPESTVVYAAVPNYGEASHQALEIFRQELKDNAKLHDWSAKGDMATTVPKFEDALDKLYQLSQYVGDEVVLAGTMAGTMSGAMQEKKTPGFLMIAEVKKPGLKDFLQLGAKEVAVGMLPPLRVLDVAELASTKDSPSPDSSSSGSFSSKQLVVLVRPDFVIAATDLEALRAFNAQVERHHPAFEATPFGQRMAKTYEGGVTLVAGADVQKLLGLIPPGTGMTTLQNTGFADMKYLVLQHKQVSGQSTSEMELSFTSPRHAIASWLAEPGPMESLDFVSPDAMMIMSVLLKNPAHIFDDIKDLATHTNPRAFDGITQMENGLNVNLRDDLFSRLTGEITVETARLGKPDAAWKIIFKLKDSDGLQSTLNSLLAATKMKTTQVEENGVTFHAIPVPSATNKVEVNYAFVDGYLLIGSDHKTLADAVKLHRTGESLAKSAKFLASLPSPQVSALVYEDRAAVADMSLRRVSPELADMFSNSAAKSSSILMAGYGEESAIREVTRSDSFDPAAILVGAAIAIPNLLRARGVANESSAVANIRTVNTAQVIYRNAYPANGYAGDLATLGPNPGSPVVPSAEHAAVLDATLGALNCTRDAWCNKSGYQFKIMAQCGFGKCMNYVVVGIPEKPSTGLRSFCSTKDGIVRSAVTSPIVTERLSPAECSRWLVAP